LKIALLKGFIWVHHLASNLE